MARIYLSPLIVDIRNKQKDTVFSKWKGINYIRSRVVPSNPKTAPQIAVRESLRGLVVLWQTAYDGVKIGWDHYTSGRNYSGFNDFIGKNTIPNRDGVLLTLTPDVGFDELLTFSADTGSSSGEIDVTFTPTPIQADRFLRLYAREVGQEAWEYKGSFGAAITSPRTIDSLTPSTVYEIYGYLRVADDPEGEEIGGDMSDTATSGA